MKSNFSRRHFLASTAGTLALPLLPSLTRGAEGEAPLRLLIVYTPNGTAEEYLWPKEGSPESNFEFGKILSPFAPYAQRMLLAKGIHSHVAKDPNNPGGPHQRGIGALFSGEMLQEGEFLDGCGSAAGWVDGPSIDQVVSQHYGQVTPFPSLELGIRANVHDVQGRISYSGPGSPLPPINDPVQLHERLFGLSADSASSEETLRKNLILNSVKDQVAQLRPRLSSHDQRVLNQHVTLVEEMQKRLQATRVLECTGPIPPTPMEADSEVTMPSISRSQFDLLTYAFACDLTRVASVQFSTGFNAMRYPWVDGEGEGHSLSHSGDSSSASWEAIAARQTWHASEIAYFMDSLAAIPEGEGSVLDNTVILWGTEVSRGNSHSLHNIPYVLLGDAHGAIWSGRYLEYDAVSNVDYLLAILAAFGIENQPFGHPDYAQGPLSGILR